MSLENADCREGMKRLPENSVSLILTDPPYFIGDMTDEWDTEKLKAQIKTKGFTSLPSNMSFSPKQGRDLQQFLSPIAEEWMRVIRPGGFCLVFSQNRLVHRTAIAIEDAGFEIRDTLLWRYKGMQGQPKAFSQDHLVKRRDISDAEKERLIRKLNGRKTAQLKPQGEMIILAQAPREGTLVDNWDKWETGLIDVSNPYLEPDRFPGTVMASRKPKERHGHLTPKPVDLLQHLIRIFSTEHQTVLDCFAGCGSTGVACKLENRHFIGYEIEKDMAERAQARIEHTQPERRKRK